MQHELEWPAGHFTLDDRRIGIGRLPNNQIVFEDVQISGLHAEIVPTPYAVLLIDLGSRNGTFVNGHRLMPDVPYTLRSGDKIRVGQIELRFWVRVGIRQHPGR